MDICSRYVSKTSAGRILAFGIILLLFASTPRAALGQVGIIQQAEAHQIAKERGWPIRTETSHGVIELQAIVNGVPKYYMTTNAAAADSISTDEVLPGGSSGLNLTGSGVTLGIWDGGGVRTSHQEYGGRATQIDSPSGTHYHSTHVAGTMIASGVVSSAKGMSPSADLDCYDWNSDTSEMISAAAAGLLVSNHSYSYITGWYYNWSYYEWFWYGDVTVSTTEDNWFGLYSSYSEELDEIAYDYPHYLMCRSGGNERTDDGPGPGGGHYYYNPSSGWEWSTDTRDPDGPWDCIGTTAIAKNLLAVAAVEDVSGGYSGPGSVSMSSFSSWGPADDGRIKPDISANGIGLYSTFDGSDSDYDSISGTSMSTPNLSGSLGVLIEYWRDTHPSDGDMRSATLKGLVLHTADETGSANGPDYKFGWGLMNTLTAANTISADVTEPVTISEQTLANSGTYEVTVYTDGTSELRASICWTDPPGTPPGNVLNPTTKMLVNDLDLRIEKSSPTTTYYPWVLNPASPDSAATTADNNTDNVEQVVVSSPGTNQYTVRVTHKGTLSGGSQDFSLIVTGVSSGCQGDPDCDDGLWCNGAETCVASQCQAGTAPDCNDSVGCTDDSCNEATDSCDHVPNNGLCDNGLYCDGSETCDAQLDCQAGTAVDCNDGVGCTDDSCNEGADSCDNIPNSSLCDNGLYCDGDETCDALLDCQAGTTVDCNDGVGCTDDSCNEGTDSCDNVPNNGLCDNGLYCDGAETCNSVSDCQPGTAVDCNDGVGCTDDSCNEGADSCDNLPNNGLCDNGLYCDGAETCDALLDCQAGTTVDCDDEVGCTDDSCNEGADSCDNLPNNGLCDNGLYCDGVETCDALLDCQTGTDPCPGQLCRESDDTCVDCLGDGDCDDGLYCNGAETCDTSGLCQSGSDPCPGQLCRESDDTCVDCLGDGDCTDALFCNGVETCDLPSGTCQPGSDPCAGLICDEEEDRCVDCLSDGDCADGLFCNGIETCDTNGVCQPGTAVDCNDGVGCTDDSCNEGADSCDNIPNDSLCDNGLYCDGAETCDALLDCQAGTAVDCDDGVG
ncbi:MAG TPA: S8 family serine peptidase, partial [Phycisphaerae bacterium]|nr:S8 family serine peptidase [Phycisphaerae bacterium]